MSQHRIPATHAQLSQQHQQHQQPQVGMGSGESYTRLGVETGHGMYPPGFSIASQPGLALGSVSSLVASDSQSRSFSHPQLNDDQNRQTFMVRQQHTQQPTSQGVYSSSSLISTIPIVNIQQGRSLLSSHPAGSVPRGAQLLSFSQSQSPASQGPLRYDNSNANSDSDVDSAELSEGSRPNFNDSQGTGGSASLSRMIPPTLGQLADQVQQRAIADLRNRGVDDVRDEDDDDDAVCAPGNEHTGRWTKEEHDKFLEALKKHGKEWKKVAAHVGTRTVVQTRTHAQKYFQKLQKTGNGSDVDMGIDTSNVSSTGARRHTINKRNRKSGGVDVGEKRARRDTDSSDEYGLSSEEQRDFTYSVPMKIIAPDPALLVGELPQPSPATCGKRKEAELAVAQLLVATATQDDKDAGEVLSSMRSASFQPGELVRRHRPRLSSLTIINPEALASNTSRGGGPDTPWEGEVLALERKKMNFEVPSFTPSERRDFWLKVRQLAKDGELENLIAVLRAAEFSEDSASARVEPANLLELSESDKQMNIKVELDCNNSQTDNEPGQKQPSNGQSDERLPSSVHRSQDVGSSLSSQKMIGIALNRMGREEATVLMLACDLDGSVHDEQKIILPMCKLLIDYGSQVGAVDKQGRTCVHRAAARNLPLVVQHLLNKGCDVNAVDENGDTALHVAARMGHLRVIHMLVESGINCHVRNHKARCALDIYPSTSAPIDASKPSRAELRRVMMSSEPRLRTLVLYHPECLNHTARKVTEWEGPDRLQSIVSRLQEEGAFPEYEISISSQFERAPVELLSRVHSPEYIAFVTQLTKDLKDRGHADGQGEKPVAVPFTPMVQRGLLRQHTGEIKADEFCDTTFSAGTLNAARRAAGAVADAVDKILLGRYRNALCVVRPPGHHAAYDGMLRQAKSCGFCIFNSVAAGALHALTSHGTQRVAIIDLDVHHGNGTEDIVRRYPNPSRLFFFSIHLYDKEKDYEFYPGSGTTDDTAHNIINVPLAPLWKDDPHPTRRAGAPQSGREAFKHSISQRLLPPLRAFNPQLILLSSGFDAAHGDVGNSKHTKTGVQPGMDMQPEDFAWITSKILEIADICCNGRVVSVLEGGYGCYQSQTRRQGNSGKLAQQQEDALDRTILSQAVCAHLRSLIDPYGQDAGQIND